jgi:predicted CoA-substrate-specific enzyme activase
MNKRKNLLGIDIGSVSISLAVIDESNRIVQTAYTFHKGQIIESLTNLLGEINLTRIRSIGYTSSSPRILRFGIKTDSRVAYITAAKMLHPDLTALMIIGAEKFGLVSFTENGEYQNYKSNTSCAAGTGSFLDQQAERLNLKNIQQFSAMAFSNKGNFPLIASRCAVFAKTDLIHAQQEGYSLEEICDGLCYGLARNIVDTVLTNNSYTSVIVAGGVALNKAVIKHLEELANITIMVDEYANVYSAIGAAINCRVDGLSLIKPLKSAKELIESEKKEQKSYYPPLELKLSDYPDFDSPGKYEFQSEYFPSMAPVEVDLYLEFNPNDKIPVFLGIDIGSTSTKAVLLGKNKEVVAGLYTRTSGQPIQAVQLIFEAIHHIEEKYIIDFEVIGSGTTGSGRKFAGKIIGVDIMPDEITAHARAAYELDPETDTIIEIGGQDSKFTVMNNGMVTFSVMNNVCAAGTGSFIEEQAKRLGCPLSEYSTRAQNARAPLASDRCTVFMERDLNHYLSEGYAVDEILASVLHSIRDNYLSKVALKGQIGRKIFFQGATAKNKSLVAAFEQKLQKPIMVSKFCHLTGALGTALELYDKNISFTKFRGIGIYKNNIPVHSETCDICTNHCKLKVAQIGPETEAYGFLCGRDYSVNKFVKNASVSFQLIQKRKEIFRFKPSAYHQSVTIGIPAGLHLHDEIPFWRKFFDLLSINTITSEDYTSAIKDGKNLCEAEFCAPIAAMHGHVDFLMQKADYVFLPIYLTETRETNINKHYCYYTQFVSSIISVQKHFASSRKILSPLLKSSQGELFVQLEIYRMLKSIDIKDIGYLQVSRAYDMAKKYVQSLSEKWRSVYMDETMDSKDIQIMLIGRPYNVLSPAMNHHIPDLFEKNGIKTFFMDMLPFKPEQIAKSEELVKTIQWKFASKLLYAAGVIAKTENCYPVLITSFKCTPDSFAVEYFKEILNEYHKPYLILQLDEHDSTVGYETRIESAIRAFRNHREREKLASEKMKVLQNGKKALSNQLINPGNNNNWEEYIRSLMNDASETLRSYGIDFKKFSNLLQRTNGVEMNLSGSFITGSNSLRNKTLLLPSWDPCVGPLLEAVLQNSGIDARLVSSTNESIQRSLSFNTGQCLPLNIIVQNAIEYIASNSLNPSETVLWLVKSDLSCNLSMFPAYAKKLLNNYGKGLENTAVYIGDAIFYDLSLQTAINAYLAYMFGGYIRKISCKIRPYEKIKGATDAVMGKAYRTLYDVFKNGTSKETALELIISDFEAIDVVRTDRPKVAIFGDLYVRDNDLMNQDLIKTVEDNGGEVITTPYSEFLKIIAETLIGRRFKEGRYLEYAKTRFLASLIPLIEEKFNSCFYRIIEKPTNGKSMNVENWLSQFGLHVLHAGESVENILKIHTLIHQYPDIALFIQTNPSYCCPSLVTEAMATRIEEITGIPVVTIEYDGTSGFKNEDIIPYLKYRKTNKKAS